MGLATVIQQFRQNSRGFGRRYFLLIVIFTAALFLDAISTVFFMLIDGAQAEMHPLVRIFAINFGPTAGPILAAFFKLFAAFIVTIYWRRFAAHIFITASVISLWAAWYNVWGCGAHEHLNYASFYIP